MSAGCCGDADRPGVREVERLMDDLAEARLRARAARLRAEGEVASRRAGVLEYLSLNPGNRRVEESLGMLAAAADEAGAAYDALEAGQAREESRLEGALADARGRAQRGPRRRRVSPVSGSERRRASPALPEGQRPIAFRQRRQKEMIG